MTRSISHWLGSLILAISLCSPLIAQTVTGTLEGTVADRSGGGLPGVTLGIKNLETGLERVTLTGPKGFYSAPFLPIGRYRLQAELAGFGVMVRQNVPIRLNET